MIIAVKIARAANITFKSKLKSIEIIGNNNQQKRCPRKTPITLSLKQNDWAFLRFSYFRLFRDFRGQIFLISDNVYY